ncbi:MAG: hypothetical protein AAGI49_14915 [Bacteroidota bacterium]
MKYLKIFSVSLFAFFLTTYLVNMQKTSNETAEEQTTMETITVKVKGVGCMTDVKTISNNVKKIQGVANCEIIEKDAITTFAVQMDTAIVTKEAVYTAIENTAGCKNPNDRPYSVKI